MLLGDGTGGPRVTGVVAPERLDGRKDVVAGAEGEQPGPCGQEPAEAGFLGQDRAARGEVTDVERPPLELCYQPCRTRRL